MNAANLRTRVILSEVLGVLALLFLLAGTSLFPGMFAIAFAGTFVLLALFLMTLKCPKCRYPLLKRERRTGMGHMTVWVGWPPKRCSRCRTSFSAERENDHSAT